MEHKRLVYSHNQCVHGYDDTCKTSYDLNLKLLAVSQETRRECSRMFYANNTFMFRSRSLQAPIDLQLWLLRVPGYFRQYIRHIDYSMTFGGYDSVRDGDLASRRGYFTLSHIAHRLPELRSITIVVRLIGYASCHRRFPTADLKEPFLPLTQLKRLKDIDIVIYDCHGPTCLVPEDAHTLEFPTDKCEYSRYVGQRDMITKRFNKCFLARKEICKKWASELRGMILKGCES